MDNYYRILDLSPGASRERIKTRYRNLVRIFHPDRFSRPLDKIYAEHKLKEFNTAYKALLKHTQPTKIKTQTLNRFPLRLILLLFLFVLLINGGLILALDLAVPTAQYRERSRSTLSVPQSTPKIDQNASDTTPTTHQPPTVETKFESVVSAQESKPSQTPVVEMLIVPIRNQATEAKMGEESKINHLPLQSKPSRFPTGKTDRTAQRIAQVGAMSSTNISTPIDFVTPELRTIRQTNFVHSSIKSVAQIELLLRAALTKTRSPQPQPTATRKPTHTPTAPPTPTQRPLPTATATIDPTVCIPQQSPLAIVRIPHRHNVNARADTTTHSEALELLTIGTQWVVEGRTVDNAWLQIVLQGERRAWVFAESVDVIRSPIETIPVIVPESLRN
ncbi:J domain-containing protein [Chloroflexi bacterium TSY]|nr:J domain-containing protein [Chloroflexi bacterium TSY]